MQVTTTNQVHYCTNLPVYNFYFCFYVAYATNSEPTEVEKTCSKHYCLCTTKTTKLTTKEGKNERGNLQDK